MSALPRPCLHVAALMDQERRLYRLDAEEEALATLRVEAWVAEEALDEPGRLEICCLADDPRLDLDALLGRPVTLVTLLADGCEHRRGGLVDMAIAEDCDGALARYRLIVRPWPWFLCMSARSQAWQERRCVEIVDSLLARYAAWARWRWSPCVHEHLQGAHAQGVRPYTVQYRETDLDFMSRLLAEDGIGYRLQHGDAGMELVFFADSRFSSPQDPSSERAPIAFQHAAAQHGADTLQRLDGHARAAAHTLATLGWCEASGHGVGLRMPPPAHCGGPHAPSLESYDGPGAAAFTTHAQAERTLRLVHEALDARRTGWRGQGVVRSFTSGTTFRLDAPLHDLHSGEPLREACLLLTRVLHVGVNNLPAQLSRALLSRLGQEPVLPVHAIPPDLLACARERGYANAFEAIHADTPWRPLRPDADGLRTFRKPDPGFLLATVVGPDGSTAPRGADEVHTDRLGRVRIRYEFQDGEDAAEGTSLSSCWVRVQQPLAGSGGQGAMGAQWTPRIGHEVLVQCLNGDIDQPVVVCSLYNGRGEGGALPTPGGREHAGARPLGAPFGDSTDARSSAQGNLTRGASPAWHGASATPVERGGQNNAAVLSGHKTKEFGGPGFNQLVHDDTPGQERLQLATTQHASQLNLGHLIHQADNHRGSFRGLGFEARTDTYGALRGACGVLLSTYLADWGAPAMEDAAGLAGAKQFQALAQTLNEAARGHQTVALSGVSGMSTAPIPAWLVQAEAQADTAAAPQPIAPVVTLSARAGVAVAAARDVAVTAGENAHLSSGAALDVAAGGAARVHAGQAIGVLGGAMQPGGEAAGTGLTLIAGAGDVELQAQDGPMQIAALRDVTFQTVKGAIDWAAAKRIVISTAGGAGFIMEGGNVEFVAPGTLTMRAGMRSFVGAASFSYAMPTLPHVEPKIEPINIALKLQDIPGYYGAAPVGELWRIVVIGTDAVPSGHTGSVPPIVFDSRYWIEILFEGTVRSDGEIPLTTEEKKLLISKTSQMPRHIWLLTGLTAMPLEAICWTTPSSTSNSKRILDALNFAANGPSLSDGRLGYLEQVAKHEINAQSMYQRKPETDA